MLNRLARTLSRGVLIIKKEKPTRKDVLTRKWRHIKHNIGLLIFFVRYITIWRFIWSFFETTVFET